MLKASAGAHLALGFKKMPLSAPIAHPGRNPTIRLFALSAFPDALGTMEGYSMTTEDKGSRLREVVVASDPANNGALVGHFDDSQFPVGGPDGAGHIASGPNPYDLLGASLAACTAMTVRFQAQRRKLPLERVEVVGQLPARRQGRKGLVRALARARGSA
jgi:organic hydroperoxide reductase OsmC/OhrA